MFIKALQGQTSLTPNPSQKINPSGLLKKKQTCFELPFHEDRVFTDDIWFQRTSIMPHIDNHRPNMKRRILKVREESVRPFTQRVKKHSRQSTLDKVEKSSCHKNLIHFNPSIFERKKNKDHVKIKNNYMSTVRETLVRTASEVPDYVRNMMKPCKIQAITISHRPVSARKTSSSNRPLPSRKTSERRWIKKSENNEFTISFNRVVERQGPIEPWEQNDFEEHSLS